VKYRKITVIILVNYHIPGNMNENQKLNYVRENKSIFFSGTFSENQHSNNEKHILQHKLMAAIDK